MWLESQEPEKLFLQGLIQVTAAFHHLQRNNPLGTMLLLKAALARLERLHLEYPRGCGLAAPHDLKTLASRHQDACHAPITTRRGLPRLKDSKVMGVADEDAPEDSQRQESIVGGCVGDSF